MSNAPYLFATYAIVVIGLAAYYVTLRRQQARLDEDVARFDEDRPAGDR